MQFPERVLDMLFVDSKMAHAYQVLADCVERQEQHLIRALASMPEVDACIVALMRLMAIDYIQGHPGMDLNKEKFTKCVGKTNFDSIFMVLVHFWMWNLVFRLVLDGSCFQTHF